MIKSILKNILRQKNLKVVNNFSIQADLRQLKNIYTIKVYYILKKYLIKILYIYYVNCTVIK